MGGFPRFIEERIRSGERKAILWFRWWEYIQFGEKNKQKSTLHYFYRNMPP